MNALWCFEVWILLENIHEKVLFRAEDLDKVSVHNCWSLSNTQWVTDFQIVYHITLFYANYQLNILKFTWFICTGIPRYSPLIRRQGLWRISRNGEFRGLSKLHEKSPKIIFWQIFVQQYVCKTDVLWIFISYTYKIAKFFENAEKSYENISKIVRFFFSKWRISEEWNGEFRGVV